MRRLRPGGPDERPRAEAAYVEAGEKRGGSGGVAGRGRESRGEQRLCYNQVDPGRVGYCTEARRVDDSSARRYMMTHLHPPTSSSLLVACLDRTGWSSDGFFGSAGVSVHRS